MLGWLRRLRYRGVRFWVLFGAVVLAVGVGPLASGGFAATEADRSATLGVVGDDAAYVGLDFAASVQSNTDNERLVTVTNNHPRSMTVTFELVGAARSEMHFSATGTNTRTVTRGSGDSTDVLVDVSQGAHTAVDRVNVSIDATAGTTSVAMYRQETNVTNPGGGGCPGGPPCGGGA